MYRARLDQSFHSAALNPVLKQPPTRRPIRSYVLRQGRLTSGQKRAFDQFWPRFGVAAGAVPLDMPVLFGNTRPIWLEIGCGNGTALAESAARHPERNFVGIEVHTPGVGHLLQRLADQNSTNVRILHEDALEVLRHRLPDQSLAGICVFFPDPWHKKRHHKRRLVQPGFARIAAQKLQPGGLLHLATDWEPYAEQMLTVLSAEPLLRNTAPENGYVPRPPERPLTRFEQRGQKLGHPVRDLIFQRPAADTPSS